jgi:hypothetical protein
MATDTHIYTPKKGNQKGKEKKKIKKEKEKGKSPAESIVIGHRLFVQPSRRHEGHPKFGWSGCHSRIRSHPPSRDTRG